MAKKKSSNSDNAPTAPLKVGGAAQDRIEVANYGAYQCQIVLKHALDEIEGWKDETTPHFVLRALLTRAHTLAEAATDLLGSELEEAETIEQARERVMHG